MTSLPHAADQDLPAGFTVMQPYGGFHTLVGPLYETLRGDRMVVGMWVSEKHLNRGSILHGGMALTLLDTAMTHACVRIRQDDSYAVTTTISCELFAPARPGDWIEAEVEINRAGGRVIFLSGVVRRDGRDGEALLRGSATFQRVRRT